MKPTTTLRLLTATTSKNEKGDLFTRLIEDLFHAQGYDKVYRDLAQPGREIDIQSEHRHESKSVAIECKAHTDTIGGDDINKFRGVVEVERGTKGKKIVAYFVSLSGFKPSAEKQEEALPKKKRVILWNAQKVIKELEACNMLLTDAEAAERAGQCAHHAGLSTLLVDEIELLAHETGYIKAVFYSQNGQRTHFALIHTGGVALADGPAQVIIAADKRSGGVLHTLTYLSPAPLAPDRQAVVQQAKECYRDWINVECGYIHLDGLPAEADYSTKSLKLERLFVPLRAIIDKENPHAEDKAFVSSKYESHYSEPKAYPISELLTPGARLALLAAPGGGKSTLLKRLATAYTSDERREQIQDGLLSHDWLPLFVRCRELRTKAAHPIKSILEEIPAQTSMQPDEADAFRGVMQEALRAGKALLLVDGLDEIPDEADRKIFAKNLRTFLALNPLITAVITSREAGFRAVAGVIADACQHARLASLEPADIKHLCTQWHIEVNNVDSLKVREQAQKLTQDIFANNSIHTLARNPLLLTTLLVVKRTIGELPRNRAGLYEEAVRLLVKTWNVEGYGFNLASLTERQALAQLSYVACTMLEEGIKQITQGHLYSLLHKAKEVLAEELHYITVSPEDFIEQVERRSSLLISVGKTSRTLETIYEFRHLTFQEYLAARGYVKEQHARRPEELKLVDILSDNFTNENWSEVIPLATVLAEHKANGIVQKLITACEEWGDSDEDEVVRADPHFVLAQCLVDEVSILPKTMTAALEIVAGYGEVFGENDYFLAILQGKAGKEFEQIIERNYFEGDDWDDYTEAMRQLGLNRLLQKEKGLYSLLQDREEIDSIITELNSSDIKRKISAGMLIVALGYELFSVYEQEEPNMQPAQARRLRAGLNTLLVAGSAPAAYTAAWALAWAGKNNLILGTSPPKAEELLTLFEQWVAAGVTTYIFPWALFEQPILKRDALLKLKVDPSSYADFLKRGTAMAETHRASAFPQAAALIGWYFYTPWNDKDLANLIDQAFPVAVNNKYYGFADEERYEIAKALLSKMGDVGKAMQKQRYSKNKAALAYARKNELPADAPF